MSDPVLQLELFEKRCYYNEERCANARCGRDFERMAKEYAPGKWYQVRPDWASDTNSAWAYLRILRDIDAIEKVNYDTKSENGYMCRKCVYDWNDLRAEVRKQEKERKAEEERERKARNEKMERERKEKEEQQKKEQAIIITMERERKEKEMQQEKQRQEEQKKREEQEEEQRKQEKEREEEGKKASFWAALRGGEAAKLLAQLDQEWWEQLLRSTEPAQQPQQFAALTGSSGGHDRVDGGGGNQTALQFLFDASQWDVAKQVLDPERWHDADKKRALVSVVRAAVDRDQRGLFHLAAARGCFDAELLTWLQEAGGDINGQSRTLRTPLHEAAQADEADAARGLVQLGADLDAKDETGATPLLLAADSLCLASFDALVAAGANVNARRQDGQNAWALAQAKGKDGEELLDRIARARERDLERPLDLQWAKRPKPDSTSVSVRQQLLAHVGSPNDDSKKFVVDTSVPQGEDRKPLEVILNGLVVPEEGVDLFASTYFDRLGADGRLEHPHAHLFRAFMYTGAAECDATDVEHELDAYERELQRRVEQAQDGQQGQVSVPVLFFLAHAKLTQRQDNQAVAVALIQLFQRLTEGSPYYSKWLSPDDKQLLDQARARSDSVNRQLPAAASPADGSVDALGAPDGSVQAKWGAYCNIAGVNAAQRKPMDDLLHLVGLDRVKDIAFSLYTDVAADKQLIEDGHAKAVVHRTLNFTFMGNPGTGKTTVARLFADLLEQAGARAGHKFVQMTASEALRKGAKQFATELASLTGGRKDVGPPPEALRRNMQVEVTCRGKWYPGTVDMIRDDAQKGRLVDVKYPDGTVEESIPESSGRIRPLGAGQSPVGGVLFLDEAYDLDPKSNATGRAILAEIMAAAEDHRDSVTIILAGYKDDIENKLFSFNVGMASRFQTVPFDDFNEAQLRAIWTSLCDDCEWTCPSSVSDVAARRVARGVGRKGFGNARSVRNLFDRSVSEAKLRYLDARNQEKSAAGDEQSSPTIAVEDVIGKEPNRATIPELDAALTELEGKTGLGRVKEAVVNLVRLAKSNYKKELSNERVDELPLNRLFLGNPGTGKTTVAAIYGRILKALRFLSNGEVVYKTASDFTGQHVGESQQKTAAIIEQAQGKVLLVDEAYVLNDDVGVDGGYGKQAINTMVEKVSGAPGEDIAVIMCGYESPMLKMLREQNPGLARRFDPAYALRFDDFSDRELLQIFASACRRDGLSAPIAVKMRAVELIAKRRALPNFGNAGAVLTAYADAKQRMSARLFKEGGARVLTMADVDKSAADERARDPLALLVDMMDVGGIRQHIGDLGQRIQVRRREGRSTDGLVNHYVFTGAPGTGKTTVARKMGAVLHAFGVLATDHVVVTSAMDLKAEYVGHTKKAVQDKMEEARGGVLFIDEAYELGHGDTFGQEAMTKLLSMLTEPEYMNGKTVVILAGYEAEMHGMLERNSGLKSRFKDYIHFDDWPDYKCVKLLRKLAHDAQPAPYQLADGVDQVLLAGFAELQTRPGWANARDVIRMFADLERQRELRIAGESTGQQHAAAVISVADAEMAIEQFLKVRPPKQVAPDDNGAQAHTEAPIAPPKQQQQTAHRSSQSHHHQHDHQQQEEEDGNGSAPEVSLSEMQDESGGMMDEVTALADLLGVNAEEMRELIKEWNMGDDEAEEEVRRRLEKMEEQDKKNEAHRCIQEIKRLQEEARRWIEEEKRRIEKLEMEKRREEERRQELLRTRGPCPMGYRWINIGGNAYQCAGGSHFYRFT